MKTTDVPIFVLAVSIVLLWNQVAISQEEPGTAATNLEAAQQISAASGRPIFAIAGRST